MVSVTPDTSDAPQRAIDRLRNPDREPAHPALEACRIVGFHQQVQMIGLDTELEHAKPALRRQAERAPDRRERALIAKRRQIRDGAKRDVCRAARDVRDSPAMRNRASTWIRWAAGAAPPSTPGADRQLQLLHRTHLNKAISQS